MGDQRGAGALPRARRGRAERMGGERDDSPRHRDPRRRHPEPQDPLVPGPRARVPAPGFRLRGPMHSLVARGEEIAAIEGVLSRAREAAGGLLLVEGPAGIGKTSLLRRARDAATDMTVLSGTGTEFEREYPFGS